MELRDGIFAVKLCELERQYGLLRSRLELCQGAGPRKGPGQSAGMRSWRRYRENGLLLERRAEEQPGPRRRRSWRRPSGTTSAGWSRSSGRSCPASCGTGSARRRSRQRRRLSSRSTPSTLPGRRSAARWRRPSPPWIKRWTVKKKERKNLYERSQTPETAPDLLLLRGHAGAAAVQLLGYALDGEAAGPGGGLRHLHGHGGRPPAGPVEIQERRTRSCLPIRTRRPSIRPAHGPDPDLTQRLQDAGASSPAR